MIGVIIYTMKLTVRQQQVLQYLHQHIQSHGLPPTLHELMAAFGWSSPAGAAKHLQALAARGLIGHSAGKARGLRLLPAGLEVLGGGVTLPGKTGIVATAMGAVHSAGAIDAAGSSGSSVRVGLAGASSAGKSAGPPERAVSLLDDVLNLPLVGRVAAGQPILAGARIERHLQVDRWLFRPQPDFLLRVQGDSMIDDGILDGDLVAGKATPEALHGQTVIARVDGGITIKRLWHRDGQLRLLPRNVRHRPIVPDPVEDFAIEGIYCGLLRRPD